jgi:hypothetical protein
MPDDGTLSSPRGRTRPRPLPFVDAAARPDRVRAHVGPRSEVVVRSWPYPDAVDLYFSDYFGVDPAVLEKYGAFDISVVSDLPVFIDPFLLFNSEEPEYRALHDGMLEYLIYLRDRADKTLDDGTMRSLYCFKEVKQNWLGFTHLGNGGAGLGPEFARALHTALRGILSDFGQETISDGSHLEKIGLIGSGVGRDNISDFTTNLIKGWLCEYTQAFALKHLKPKHRQKVAVPRAVFSYDTETWATRRFTLPVKDGDYLLLTPEDILTRDATWINQKDMIRRLSRLPDSVSDVEQRARMNAYLGKRLQPKMSQKARADLAVSFAREFPEILDVYIKIREDDGDRAVSASAQKVSDARQRYIEAIKAMLSQLDAKTEFYDAPWTTYEECLARVQIFKDFVEHEDGYQLFNPKGTRLPSQEKEVQLAFKLVWAGSQLDVNREVNNGRGPVDYKTSMGAGDKSLIEFKLASNSKLKANLQKQVSIYEAANGTRTSVKIIVCFTRADEAKVDRVLRALKLTTEKSIVVIDARNDNKPSASKA